MDQATAAEARRLRVEEGMSARQIMQRLGVNKQRLYEYLRGVPAPEWTRRPNAKDDLRERATELRSGGWSVNDIALELGVAKSTAYQWVRHLPLDPDSERARAKRAHAMRMTDARWEEYRRARDERRANVHTAAGVLVNRLDHRDLALLAAAIYWSEGEKAKPWRRDHKVSLVNSDPLLLAVFLRFLESIEIARSELRYRVSIHESADPDAAVAWWVETLGVPRDRFYPTAIKRHVPGTNRRNTGEGYHGCLIISVPRGREVYWFLEGIVKAVGAVVQEDPAGPAR